MKQRKLERISPAQILEASVLFSLLSSLAVYFVTRGFRVALPTNIATRATDGERVGTTSVPVETTVQPAPASIPPAHFSEATIVPGFTETGEQIERQDDADGRSPGGV